MTQVITRGGSATISRTTGSAVSCLLMMHQQKQSAEQERDGIDADDARGQHRRQQYRDNGPALPHCTVAWENILGS